MKDTASFTIRPAAPADAPAIFSLTTALAGYEKLPLPDAASAARLQKDMVRRPPRFQAWLAEADGKPVGYALGFDTYSTFLAAPKYYLEDIFVLPEYRGRGIGHAFFRTLAAEAVRRGCVMMEWTALDWNKPAQDFYKGLGAKHMEIWQVFRLEKAEVERLAQS